MSDRRPSKPRADNLQLVGLHNSRRLQAMRESQAAAKTIAGSTAAEPAPAEPNRELLLAGNIIASHLENILATLPAGKQQRLFKIRFGVELAELGNLSIERLIGLLKIPPEALQPVASALNRIGRLKYNEKN